jgi:RimJ/RimL family protein N-acetyltransferase
MEEFRVELEKDFAFDRHEQYIICRRSDSMPVGTIFSYGLNRFDGHVFITTFLEDDYVGSGFGAEAFILFAIYLIQKFGLFKIYADVYEYNLLSMKTLLKWGFKEEGRFKQHRVYNDRRWDMVRLAVYATDLERALRFGRRLGIEEEKETA